ncbi:MAG TPA: hypothetical protein VME20_11925 [Acidimicrobiales bacterium]|nr:hypothetical protein [Acidimicrobiales bacterium]
MFVTASVWAGSLATAVVPGHASEATLAVLQTSSATSSTVPPLVLTLVYTGTLNVEAKSSRVIYNYGAYGITTHEQLAWTIKETQTISSTLQHPDPNGPTSVFSASVSGTFSERDLVPNSNPTIVEFKWSTCDLSPAVRDWTATAANGRPVATILGPEYANSTLPDSRVFVSYSAYYPWEDVTSGGSNFCEQLTANEGSGLALYDLPTHNPTASALEPGALVSLADLKAHGGQVSYNYSVGNYTYHPGGPDFTDTVDIHDSLVVGLGGGCPTCPSCSAGQAGAPPTAVPGPQAGHRPRAAAVEGPGDLIEGPPGTVTLLKPIGVVAVIRPWPVCGGYLEWQVTRAGSSDWTTVGRSFLGPAPQSWLSLPFGPTGGTIKYSHEAAVAGKFVFRWTAFLDGAWKSSENEVRVSVLFPTIYQIASQPGVEADALSAWNETVYKSANQQSRHEIGYWVTLDTCNASYGHTPEVLGPTTSNSVPDAATLKLGRRPQDDPKSAPFDSCATYVVASFHTHTPTFYLPKADPPRPVGPSTQDKQATEQNGAFAVPGLVYDYCPAVTIVPRQTADCTQESGTIPSGWALGNPAKLWLYGPLRRLNAD